MKKIFNYKDFMKNLNESALGSKFANLSLVNKIDYTLLKPEATEQDIIELCEKANKLGVKSVCVLPKMVKIAAESLQDSNVLVCTVVSFPQGTNLPEKKLSETKRVISDGADEVDMVLDYTLLKQGMNNQDDFHVIYEELVEEVRILVDECHKHQNKDGEPIILKVIVESSCLSEEETEQSTYICLDAGADFIKTSTGMITPDDTVGVAELDKVQIMRQIINKEGSDMKIKASGGIRTMSDLQKFAPLVDRFGVGYAAVDSIFGEEKKPIVDSY